MNKYEVTLIMELENNPDSWDWGSLLDLSVNETLESVYVEEI
jgi:hypothetical protein